MQDIFTLLFLCNLLGVLLSLEHFPACFQIHAFPNDRWWMEKFNSPFGLDFKFVSLTTVQFNGRLPVLERSINRFLMNKTYTLICKGFPILFFSLWDSYGVSLGSAHLSVKLISNDFLNVFVLNTLIGRGPLVWRTNIRNWNPYRNYICVYNWL